MVLFALEKLIRDRIAIILFRRPIVKPRVNELDRIKKQEAKTFISRPLPPFVHRDPLVPRYINIHVKSTRKPDLLSFFGNV